MSDLFIKGINLCTQLIWYSAQSHQLYLHQNSINSGVALYALCMHILPLHKIMRTGWIFCHENYSPTSTIRGAITTLLLLKESISFFELAI